MPGFWVEPADIGEERLVLRGDEAHHLLRVRRYGLGDEFEAIDGVGCCYRARIERAGESEVEAAIVARSPEKGESPVRLHLAPALIKGQGFDYVVEKATEVGVASIRPLAVERGVVRPGSKRKRDRWQRLAQAATKQCGRSRMPLVAAPQSLGEALVGLARDCDAIWLATPDGQVSGIAAIAARGPVGAVGLLVGPEGGFTAAEVACARASGAPVFSLGDRVLRADTAGVVLAALVIDGSEVASKKGGGQLG